MFFIYVFCLCNNVILFSIIQQIYELYLLYLLYIFNYILINLQINKYTFFISVPEILFLYFYILYYVSFLNPSFLHFLLFY